MRKRFVVSGVAALVLSAGALVFTLTAGAGANRKAAPTVGECYPTNAFTFAAGSTTASISQYQSKVAFNIEPLDKKAKDDGSEREGIEGTVTINMTLSLAGTMTGSLKASWSIKGHGTGSFTANCIQEGSTEADDGADTDTIETEWEGTAKGVPWVKGDQPAVVTIEAKHADGKPVIHFNLEAPAKTCFENGGEFSSTNDLHKKWQDASTGTIAADSSNAGRWNIPPPFPANVTNPCQSVFTTFP